MWVKSGATSEASNVVREFAPELIGCRDLRRGARLETSKTNGQEYYNVTFEREGPEIVCPLGYVERLIRTHLPQGRAMVREEVSVQCEDRKRRRGVVLSKRDGDHILALMEEWTRDPRPSIRLDDFAVSGKSFAPEWTLCVTLLVCYSTVT